MHSSIYGGVTWNYNLPYYLDFELTFAALFFGKKSFVVENLDILKFEKNIIFLPCLFVGQFYFFHNKMILQLQPQSQSTIQLQYQQ